MNYTEELKQLGLTNTESTTYISLLKLGPSKSGEIIKKSKLQSSSVYNALTSLQEKGLVSFSHYGKQKIFQSESPNKLLDFIEDKKRTITTILPDLNLIENISTKKNSSKVFSGLSGIKSVLNDILSELEPNDEYYFLQLNQNMLLKKEILLLFRNYHLKREEKQIKVKGLASHETKESILTIFEGMSLFNVEYVNEFLPTGIIIYANKIIFLDLEEEPNAFVIESKTISESYKQFFESKYNNL
jgi:sugar-specific transcriptional regulator TrmB